jgi:hypothetical protein
MTNLDEFEKVVHKTVLEYYDKGEFPMVKKVTLAIKKKLYTKV